VIVNEKEDFEEDESSTDSILIPTSYSEPYAWSTSLDSKPPLLISSQCTRALADLFRNTYYSTIPNFPIPNHNHTNNNFSSDTDALIIEEEEESNYLLSLLVESSSHPVGLSALEAQPWLYAGPGLGNMDACPLQTCIAGGNNRRDSVVFAAVCIVPECSAYDLAAADFVPTAQRQLQYIQQQYNQYNSTSTTSSNTRNTWELAKEYIVLLQHIAEINKFLGTGWTCGDFVVPWTPWPFGIPYFLACTVVFVLCVIPKHNHKLSKANNQQKQHKSPSSVSSSSTSVDPCCSLFVCQSSSLSSSSSLELNHKDQRKSERAEEDEEVTMSTTLDTPSNTASNSMSNWQGKDQKDWKNSGHERDDDDHQILPFLPYGDSIAQKNHATTFHFETTDTTGQSPHLFWSAFDLTDHWHRLVRLPPRDTACLDGMRVGSIFWIMLGHCMAIQSSTGAGYSNPASFLPPSGLTTTWLGQLLFSSRLAVDSFLVLSGYLVTQGLYQKLPLNPRLKSSSSSSCWSLCRHVLWRYCYHIPSLLLNRIARILPLYAFCLGFYTQVAPHLDFGKYPSPFWFQWIGLLKPCQDNIWTNVLFVNNFIPFDTPTTNTCFYHSWYLAVDMQLFLLAPLLVFLYQVDPRRGKYLTLALLGISVAVTAYLSWVRRWSVNTFDGAAVARYDMEAYAKPHVRAQAYLAGMYVAMLLIDDKTIRQSSQKQQHDQQYGATQKRGPYLRKQRLLMGLCLLVMVIVTFITATGAYSRRPCTYREDPWKDPCGSSWSREATFVYTAFSRTAWCLCIAGLVHLCIGRAGSSRHELVADRHALTRDGSNRSMVSSILSWHCWAPLSHLSFGAYLIHPIVIFIWQLGDREKEVFRLFTFGMDYLSVCVVSFVAALLAALFVEFPLATLWRNYTSTNKPSLPSSGNAQLVMPEDIDSAMTISRTVDQDGLGGAGSSRKLLAFSSSSVYVESNYGSMIHSG
jgi:peptidoglycan/LPS O-acetylase OafA/YrhL